MDLTVRKAERHDMTEVLNLIIELAVFEKEPNAVQVTVAELQKHGFGENPMFSCFVAEMGDEIVGMALIYFRFSTWVGMTVHLEDLVVKEAVRGKGVGKALYSEVMRYAKAEGVKRVNWMVLGWNEGAIRFYERTGANVMKDWWQVEMDEIGLNNYLKNL